MSNTGEISLMDQAEAVDFLKHYGVPGMKWGRHKRSDSSSGGSNHSQVHYDAYGNEVAAPKKMSKAKKAGLIAGGAAVVVGAAFAASALHKSGDTSTSSLSLDFGSSSHTRVGRYDQHYDDLTGVFGRSNTPPSPVGGFASAMSRRGGHSAAQTTDFGRQSFDSLINNQHTMSRTVSSLSDHSNSQDDDLLRRTFSFIDRSLI
jgi:hypothetical protein